MQIPQPPSLIVVTGRPGSGKTSLAHALARAVRCPAICRDEIKEGFIHAAGDKGDSATVGDDAARTAYDAFFDTIKLMLSRRITLVAEAAFQHKRWAPSLEPLRDIARIRIIVCQIDPQLARSRVLQRGEADPARARFHPAPAPALIDEYDPPRLDVPTLTVETSDGYQPPLETIAAFARG